MKTYIKNTLFITKYASNFGHFGHFGHFGYSTHAFLKGVYNIYSTSGAGGGVCFKHVTYLKLRYIGLSCFSSYARLRSSEHPWFVVDRLDPYMDVVTPDDLKGFNFGKADPGKKVKYRVYGLHSYVFSDILSMQIDAEVLDNFNPMIMKAAISYLNSLKDNTIYKCIFVGILGSGAIKSSNEGGFFVTKHTRPEYITMKIKSGVKQFVFRYRDERFDSYSLAYKEWLLSKDLGVLQKDALDAVEKAHVIEESNVVAGIPSEDVSSDLRGAVINVSLYHRWIDLVGVIGDYKLVDSCSKYIVKTICEKSCYKVEVECVELCDLVSWTDMWLDDKAKLWVRKFKGGVHLFYQGDIYLRYEVLFNTEVWEDGVKEFEYNDKFGVLDIEAYKIVGIHGDGLQIPYAAGFTDYKGNTHVFYVKDGEPEFMVLVRTLEVLLTSKYSGGVFYAHNLTRYDGRLILHALGLMEGVSCSLWGRDMHNIFKIRISKKVGARWCNITLLDSYYMLPFKLDELGKKFNTTVKKTHFPYDFVSKSTLFYKGVTPPFSNYKGKITESEYRGLCINTWDLKEETLIYLVNDLVCLHQVMHKYNKTVFKDFLVNAVKYPSYSALSKGIYITNYYPKVGLKIPVLTGYLEVWCRRGYKGGIVDLIRHLVCNAIKYDSNSHYPAAMLRDMPVGIPRFSDEKDLSKIFGFCYVEVTAPSVEELRCTILPTQNDMGELYCPRGTWRDTYFSEELKNAVKYGYIVKVITTLQFDRGVGLFEEFVREMFNRKATAKEMGDAVGELLYKLTQNSLYGKSGQKEIIHRFKVIDSEDVQDFERKHNTDLSHVFGNKTLLRTQGKISGDLEGVITKLYGSKIKNSAKKSNDVDSLDSLPLPARKKGGVKSSVAIAAAITAYARIAMSQYKNIKGNAYLGGDTDSAIMEKELDPNLVGKGLGMMKLECRIKLGLFVEKKLYMTEDYEGRIVIRSRGIGRSLETGLDILSFDDFIKLFKGEVLTLDKTKFIIKSDGIYVNPQKITTRISPTSLDEVTNEISTILKDNQHPLYEIALMISCKNHSLVKYKAKQLALVLAV